MTMVPLVFVVLLLLIGYEASWLAREWWWDYKWRRVAKEAEHESA